MKPLISSCRITASFRSGWTDSTCPCSVQWRPSVELPLPQAAVRSATARQKAVPMRIPSSLQLVPMIWVGTSGYNYPEWKGSFYPEKLPSAKMLPYYAARFPTVEINYTFYRMPNEKLVSGWAEQTPAPYRLTLKAPRRITHDSRLKNTGELVQSFCRVAGSLSDKLGALLFQLPPNLKKDIALFDAFLEDLPPRVCAAFEFRNPSWFDDEVFERLRARNL